MTNIPINKIAEAGLDQGISEVTDSKNKAEGNFEAVINNAMGQVSQMQNDVEKAVNELATGGDITSAIIAVQKADASFQLMVEVRNKLISAYEQVMRMQI
jgi:flagellar hook-basal body complex protein FliE